MTTQLPEVALRRVAGTVRHSDGCPIGGLLIHAFHRQVGGQLALGKEGLTDGHGRYTIPYQAPAGLSRIDLFVRATDDQTVVATSPITIGAETEEVVDLEVVGERYRGPSEFDVVSTTLTPEVENVDVGRLDADDIALLVRRTHLRRTSVTAWIAASRLARRTGIDPESLYGLLRIENIASLPLLLRRPPARLQRALVEAAGSNVISVAAGQRASETVASLRRVGVDLSVSTATPNSLGRLLATGTTSTAAQQETFIRRYADHAGPVQKLWRQLRTDPAFGDSVVEDLQLSIQLGVLTGNHPPLVAALRQLGITHPAQAAALTATQWRRLLTGKVVAGTAIGTPAIIKGTTAAERRRNYLTLLNERSAKAYPTALVARTLKRLPAWKSSTAVAFLDRNPGFNVLSADLQTGLTAANLTLDPEWDREHLQTELATVQRVSRLAPEGLAEPVVDALLSGGYTSALAIARSSRSSFRRKTAIRLGDEQTADIIYRQAQFQVSRTASAYALMNPAIAGGLSGAIGTIAATSTDGNPSGTATDPTWASLFGSVDYCECEHCRSIYSPAAYLVALLSWLDGHDAGPRTAVDLLNDRRPDLERIELSCNNTNTAMPYVDLVNEILAVRVLNPSGRRPNAPTVPTATTATSPEVLADPEHLIAAAYDDHLATQVSPHTLPFDLWAALGRVYFEHLGVQRSDLMETLRRDPRAADIDAERLRITGLERRILLGTANHDGWEYWGYPTATTDGVDYKADLAVVTNLLRRAEIDYETLLDLLHVRYLRPGGVRIIGAESDTNEMTITPAADEVFERMDQTLRLWRNRGGTLLDLDKTLVALNIDTFDEASLARLADLDRLQDLTGAPLTELLSWWAPIDTRSDRLEKEQPVPSLYTRIFLNRAVDAGAGEPDFPLALNPDRTELAQPPAWSDIRSLLTATLKINDADLGLLLDEETGPGIPNDHRVVTGDVATVAGLSALYRHVNAAAHLALPLGDFLGVLRLTGIAPFDLLRTDATLNLVRTVHAIHESGFTLAEQQYLLEHDPVANVSFGITDQAIAQLLTDIRAGLTRVAADSPLDAKLDVDKLPEAQSDAVIIEKVAGFAGLALDSTADLLGLRLQMSVGTREVSGLTGFRTSPYVTATTEQLTPADDPEAFAAARRVHKAALVLSRLGLSLDAQMWLFDVGVRNGLLNPLALPTTFQRSSTHRWTGWARLEDLAALETDLPGGEPTLTQLLQLLQSEADPAVAEPTFQANLAARTGWLSSDIETLVNATRPEFPADWRDGRTLRRLLNAQTLIGRLGVSAKHALRWAEQDVDATTADELRLAAKAKHDEDSWPVVARALRDPVRELQRAALVSYLVATDDGYDDTDALFDDLLIDVSMTPCMLTSRITQAISSVQLFVQRCFLNLEPLVELTRDDQAQWEWMKNYRVWEAARKVFLTPENFIEPELRVNKSPLFVQLENDLLQGDLNDVAAEQAYTAYLEGLLKIARMQVLGLYHQYEADDDGTVDVLHVVARTKAQPYEYYYRQWVDGYEWTAWEPIDIDVDDDSVVLAVHDRRLFVFWPSAVQRVETDEVDAEDRPIPNHVYDLTLSWTERLNGQWSPHRKSDQTLVVDGSWDGPAAQREFTYFRLADSAQLVIECRQAYNTAWPQALLIGTFTLDSSSGSLVANAGLADTTLVAPANNYVQGMRFDVRSALAGIEPPVSLSVMSGATDEAGRLVGAAFDLPLIEMESGSSLAYPHQYGEFASQHGVFLDDTERTFHVMPEPALIWKTAAEPDSADPAVVGTTDSDADVLVQPKEENFEPELEWDKTQEPALASAKRQTPGGSASIRNTGGLTAATGALSELTTAALTLSQDMIDAVSDTADLFVRSQSHRYRFSLFDHHDVGDFMTELRRSGPAGLLDPNPNGSAPRLVRQQKSRDFFMARHQPSANVLTPYPVQQIDFAFGSATATYNWDLFFHAPMLIAGRLAANQKFDEARRWYHFVFDPTNRTNDDDPLRFWKIKPFYRSPDAPIEDFLALAASGDTSAEAEAARAAYDLQIAAATRDPFNPHRIAELRTTAYQKALVMKYLDNLLAWGDQLFRSDSIESLNEATQLYLLGLRLLGTRPVALPPRNVAINTTFEQVRADMAATVLDNPLVQLENAIFPTTPSVPKYSPVIPVANSWGSSLFPAPTVPDAATRFYFCIPPNEKLSGYWDAFEDRLFKIRNCMNIEGVVRQLPLFEPPIDPALLVRARAAGVDLSSALTDLSAPLPHYRFAVMLQKAYAMSATVRALGNALNGALDKNDAEALALLRATQEVAVNEAVRDTKDLAVVEAKESLAAAEQSLTVVQQRSAYYLRLITTGLRHEEIDQPALMEQARKKQRLGSTAAGFVAALANIPTVVTGASGIAGSPVATSTIVSGLSLAMAGGQIAQQFVIDAVSLNAQAAIAGIVGAYGRRSEEWLQQLELARREADQIEKQIEAAKVRVALAEREQAVHEKQIEHAASTRNFMESKFTNVELAQWMLGQLSTLFFQTYQVAYDMAKRAEQAYRHELALPTATFIQFGYWDSLRKGLESGERLQLDLERMDKAYLDNNAREYEITKHVSLAGLDPVALLQLQTHGACEFSIPESWFDLDGAGQYLRRLKSVAVTVPCVTGPYTGVPMRLTLVSSRTRVDPTADRGYPYDLETGDDRFQVQAGAIQSIVINSGREDSGLFVTDLRDERYLPFEGSGAISDWSLSLTSAVATFDWSTITDVVLHLRYTAREGGQLLRLAALEALGDELDRLPLRRGFSARSEFATEWHAFLRPTPADGQPVFAIELGAQLFPYLARSANLTITSLEVVTVVADPVDWRGADVILRTGSTVQQVPLLSSEARHGGQPAATFSFAGGMDLGRWEIEIPTDPMGPAATWMSDLVLLVTYAVELGLG